MSCKISIWITASYYVYTFSLSTSNPSAPFPSSAWKCFVFLIIRYHRQTRGSWESGRIGITAQKQADPSSSSDLLQQLWRPRSCQSCHAVRCLHTAAHGHSGTVLQFYLLTCSTFCKGSFGKILPKCLLVWDAFNKRKRWDLVYIKESSHFFFFKGVSGSLGLSERGWGRQHGLALPADPGKWLCLGDVL